MNALKSKTILFNLFMAALETANGTFAILEPILDQQTFILVAFTLGLVHAMGGVYFRMITVKPVNEL